MVQRPIQFFVGQGLLPLKMEQNPEVNRAAPVPIIKPSSGLNPPVVATATPPRTAVAKQPPPRWQLMMRNWSNPVP